MRRGIALLLLLAACDAKPAEPPPAKHEHRAPHGGTLVELGKEFAHVEFVLEAATGQLTAYVLDGEAEKSIRLSQEEISVSIQDPAGSTTVALKAVGSPLTGEKSGDTSQFEARTERLKGAKEFSGSIVKILVQGRQFDAVAFAFPGGNEGMK